MYPWNFFFISTLRINFYVKQPTLYILIKCISNDTATEENGGPSEKVPDSQQPDLLCSEQVSQVQRLWQPPSGTRPVFSASYPPITGNHHMISTHRSRTELDPHHPINVNSCASGLANHWTCFYCNILMPNNLTSQSLGVVWLGSILSSGWSLY